MKEKYNKKTNNKDDRRTKEMKKKARTQNTQLNKLVFKLDSVSILFFIYSFFYYTAIVDFL